MPDLDLGPDQIVCSYETATVQANITDGDTYAWTVNGAPYGSGTSSIEISGTGEYDVVLTMDKGPCTVTDSMHVTVLEPIVITTNPILYGELEVNVTGGLAPYQYALNDGDYQSSNHFYELPDDDYTVHVKDANGCEADTLTHVTNLIFPPYFTPNNDGHHDNWRITNSELMPDAELYIYDRFGRLLVQMNTSLDQAWNGLYNGSGLPADDYWYVLILPTGRTYKGHFSLIR
jgi:gliding motility-associated-like protein